MPPFIRNKTSKRPPDNIYTQQQIQGWRPILSPNQFSLLLLLLAAIFLPLGFVIRNASSKALEYKIQYDGSGSDPQTSKCQLTGVDNAAVRQQMQQGTYAPPCTIIFNVEQEMKAPVRLYFELGKFFQNHREYVASVDDNQLTGKTGPSDSACPDANDETIDGVRKVLFPCGRIANSFFNDIILLKSNEFSMSQSGFAWSTDVSRFKNIDPTSAPENTLFMWNNPVYNRSIQSQPQEASITDVTAWTESTDQWGVTNEHFVSWMRPAGLPRFRKLYGIIDANIPKGTQLEFSVFPNFVVSQFDGSKSLVLSTKSWVGQKNPFIGYVYIAMGGISALLAIFFFVYNRIYPRMMGEETYLTRK